MTNIARPNEARVAVPDTVPLAKLAIQRPLRFKRAIIALAFVALALAPAPLGALTREQMTDAFTQVSAFVAATLLLFYGAERVFRFSMGETLKGARWMQVPLASLLGATPGCGGAVIVIAAYSSGNVGFGAVVATLTATMGDAAFLLIATRPDAALVVLPLSFATGILFGWFVDVVHPNGVTRSAGAACELAPRIGRIRPRDIAYLVPLFPALAVGVAQLAQIELTTLFGIPITVFALIGTGMGLVIWVLSPVQAMTHPDDAPVTRMAEETSFISVWVIGAYLTYEYAAQFLGLDLAALFSSIAPLLPLIAILIGFIPGCGPQVLVTTLYINGLIPFAALLGNAISNDGDALFPAIALEPRAAVLATAYTAIPALILSYIVYYGFPNVLN
jgi:hypothetical protein